MEQYRLVCLQILAQTLTKKEGSLMLSVLKELHYWLGDTDAKRAKDKQKLMRNLRVSDAICMVHMTVAPSLSKVLEQLRDILKHPTPLTV